jgi:hypothetical protein
MAMEGSEVDRRLREAHAQAEARVAAIREEADALELGARDHDAQRGEAVLELARLELPQLTPEAIRSTIESARSRLLDVLERKKTRIRELAARKQEAAAAAATGQADLDVVTAQLNDLVDRREKLELQVAEALQKRADFVERSTLAAEAEENLHRNEGRVAEIERDAREKLPAYQSSRLFQYLYKREYGTTEYKGRGWIDRLDRWVARMIDYPRARRGYEFLLNTPSLVAAEVKRRRDVFDQLMDQVEAIQKEEADRLGLTPVLEKGKTVGEQRDRLVARLNELRDVIQKIEGERARLDQGQDAFHAEAIETLRDVLERTEQRVLNRRADASPTPEDDAIVARLAQATQRLEEVRVREAELAEERRHAVAVRASLEDLRRRFREANFDSTRSVFSDDRVLESVLDGLDSGRINAAQAWELFRRTHHFRPSPVEIYYPNGASISTGSTGRILTQVLIQAAGAALNAAATSRSIQRRGGGGGGSLWGGGGSWGGGSWGGGGGSWGGGGGGSRDGGFTSGSGF